MSDIPNRDDLEKQLAKVLGNLLHSQMGKLLELMGDPPDISKVPPEFWDEGGVEFRDKVRPFLNSLFVDQAKTAMDSLSIGVNWTLINERAAIWASQYTFDLVRGITDTSRSYLQGAIERYFRDGQTIGELQDALMGAYGPVRAEMIAVTEVTRAAVQGEIAVFEELAQEGIEMAQVWNTNNDELVCPICGPRNQKKKGQGWTEPPPAHPRCRCWINLEIVE